MDWAVPKEVFNDKKKEGAKEETAVKEETDDTCADTWEEGADCENDPDLKYAIENIPSEDKTVLQANSSQDIENEQENVITSKRETEFVQAAVLESCIKSDPSPNSTTTKTFKEKETNDVPINSKYTLIPRVFSIQFNEYTGTRKEFWRENFVKETLKVSIIRKTILHKYSYLKYFLPGCPKARNEDDGGRGTFGCQIQYSLLKIQGNIWKDGGQTRTEKMPRF